MKNPKFLTVILATCIAMQSCAIFAKDDNWLSKNCCLLIKEITYTKKYKQIVEKFDNIKKWYIAKKKSAQELKAKAETLYAQHPIKIKIGAATTGAGALWLAIEKLPKKVTFFGTLLTIAVCYYKFVYKRGDGKTIKVPVIPVKTPETPGNPQTIVILPGQEVKTPGTAVKPGKENGQAGQPVTRKKPSGSKVGDFAQKIEQNRLIFQITPAYNPEVYYNNSKKIEQTEKENTTPIWQLLDEQKNVTYN